MNGTPGGGAGENTLNVASRARRACRCCGVPAPSARMCCCSPRIPVVLGNAIVAAAQRLDLSLRPSDTIRRVRAHRWRWTSDFQYLFMISVALISLHIAPIHFLFKLLIIAAYTFVLLIPLTSQFFLPASPIFTWVVLYFSCRHIPLSFRSHIHIWVSVLPTLESVLYGANISDILTRYTNPVLDLIAWIPYGVLHFVLPFVVGAFLFVFGGPGAVKFFGKAFGYLNLFGVIIQIFFPCAPPWYELTYGLIPADYSMHGSAGGLARIDAIFHSHGYTETFSHSPMIFGAFPSLHAGSATMEALFLSHYFPRGRIVYWTYAFVLYWSTMYLTHHYLVDLVAGGSLAVACFYIFLTDDQRHLPMLNATAAGESDSLAKGYETGVRGMLGHRGATGLWTSQTDLHDPEGYPNGNTGGMEVLPEDAEEFEMPDREPFLRRHQDGSGAGAEEASPDVGRTSPGKLGGTSNPQKARSPRASPRADAKEVV